jgi:hypothetical protein
MRVVMFAKDCPVQCAVCCAPHLSGCMVAVHAWMTWVRAAVDCADHVRCMDFTTAFKAGLSDTTTATATVMFAQTDKVFSMHMVRQLSLERSLGSFMRHARCTVAAACMNG